MASKGDLNKNKIQPVLSKKWEVIEFESSLKKTGSFTKLKSNQFEYDGLYPVIDQGEGESSGYISDPNLIYKGEIPVVIFGDHTRNIKYVDYPFGVGADGTKILCPIDKLKPKFFYYYLRVLRIPSFGYSRHYKALKEVDVPLPPLPEQERIVTKLDSLFAHLEETKKRLEKIPELLKQFRQAVLTQAVTGKLTEEWREGKELEGVDSLLLEENRISAIENENVQLEKLGKRKQKETPFTVFEKNELGWLIVNVESACVFIVDCLHNTPQFESTGFYVIDTTCISPFKIDWEKARKVNSEYFEKWTERLTPNYGDVLFSREGTIGIAVKVPKGAELCIGQRMMLFRMAKFVLPEYAEIYFNSFIFRDEYFPHIKGVAAQHLNIGSIRELPFPIPSFPEQTEIVRRVESLFAKADAIEGQYKKLKEQIDQLPQAILAKAFRGEV